jgi:hypothetical protein
MLHTLRFIMRFRPREPDHIGKQHFGELMAQSKPLRK